MTHGQSTDSISLKEETLSCHDEDFVSIYIGIEHLVITFLHRSCNTARTHYKNGRQIHFFPLEHNAEVSHKKHHAEIITKTCLYNFDPLKSHFYIIKLGFTGVYIIFLISSQKHRLWVLVRTASPRRF